MQAHETSPRVATFKLAAALEKYEMDLRIFAHALRHPELLRRLQEPFGELCALGASLPRLSVSWVAVLISRERLVQAIGTASEPVTHFLQEHLAAVEGMRTRCLRAIGAQAVAVG